jgi:predicted RNase H-like HicB family nuclease
MTQTKHAYAIVIEKTSTGFSCYAPDLPGCVASARTKKQLEKLMAEAIALHIASLREHGNNVPTPSSIVEYIEPAVA